MDRKERIAVLKEYYDEANVGGQPNKYLIRKQQALQETIAEAELLDKMASCGTEKRLYVKDKIYTKEDERNK